MNILKKSRFGTAAVFAAVCLMTVIPLFKATAFPFLNFSILNNINPSQAKIEKASFNNNSQNVVILEAANHADPNPAKGGGEISVVDGTALYNENIVAGTAVDINKPGNNGRISIYEVRPGDTLSQIADMFDVSVNTIRWANDLGGSIQPGQSLVILPISGVKHVVKNGGSIADVAKIYDADAREIALFNGLDEKTVLAAGDEIIVPHAEIKTEQKTGQEKGTAGSGATLAVSKNAPQTNANVAAASGYYGNPVPGAILTQGLHGYSGVDFGAPLGTPIYAAAAGSVITSRQDGWNGGYGAMVVVDHSNGTQTLYAHMSRNVAYVGQKVKKGELIGYVGSTGRSTGNHLHFEVRGSKNPFATSCSVGRACY